MLELNKVAFKLSVFNNEYTLRMSLNGESCEISRIFSDSNKALSVKKLISKNIWYFVVKNYSVTKHKEQKDGVNGISAFREKKSINYLEVQDLVIAKHLVSSDYFELKLDTESFDYLNFENIIFMHKKNPLRINSFFDLKIIEEENPEYYIWITQ